MTPRPPTAVPGEERLRRAVVVFTRAPEDEERAKLLMPARGRLAPGQRAHTASLHRRLIEHTLSAAAAVTDADVLLVTTGDLGRSCEVALRQVPATRLRVLRQNGHTFVERFETAIHHAFMAGYDQVVAIGSDTPELGVAELEETFARLAAGAPRQTTAVIGPSRDGGYYLLGLSQFSPAAFAGITFGGPRVAANTAAQLERAGCAVSLLAPLIDIDQVTDLGAVATRLRARRRPGDALLHAALLLVLSAQPAPILPAAPHPHSLTEFLPRDTRGPPLA